MDFQLRGFPAAGRILVLLTDMMIHGIIKGFTDVHLFDTRPER